MTTSHDSFFHCLQPLDPKDPDASKRSFDECYSLLNELSYLNSLTESNKPHFFGEKANQKCSLCGETPQTKSFSNDAHILPASLGNRVYFSHEECNECNEKYGKFENALADMLAPQKAIAGIRKRKGMPKLKVPDQKSYLKRDSSTGILQIHIHDIECTFSMDELGQDAFSLKVPAPPYNPISALKSLLHTMWLTFDNKHRNDTSWLLAWLKDNDLPPCPVSYYDAFSPGPGFMNTVFRIWERKPEIEYVSQYIVHLQVGNTILLFPLDENLSSNSYVDVLPPLQLSNYSPFEPRMTKVTITENQVLRPKQRTFTIHYDSKTPVVEEVDVNSTVGINCQLNSGVSLQQTEKLSNPTPILCALVVKDKEGVESKIDRTYIQYGLQSEFYSIELAGGEFAGSLMIRHEQQNEQTISHCLTLSNVPLSVAKGTLCLLKRLVNADSIEIRPYWKNLKPMLLPIKNYNATNDFIEMVDNSLELVNAIQFINEKFDLRLKYPEEIDNENVRLAHLIYRGVSEGAVQEPIKELLNYLPKAQVDLMISIIGNDKKSIEGKNLMSYQLWGQKINVGNIVIELVNASFSEPLESLKSRIQNLNSEEMVEIKLACDCVNYWFEDYLKVK